MVTSNVPRRHRKALAGQLSWPSLVSSSTTVYPFIAKLRPLIQRFLLYFKSAATIKTSTDGSAWRSCSRSCVDVSIRSFPPPLSTLPDHEEVRRSCLGRFAKHQWARLGVSTNHRADQTYLGRLFSTICRRSSTESNEINRKCFEAHAPWPRFRCVESGKRT